MLSDDLRNTANAVRRAADLSDRGIIPRKEYFDLLALTLDAQADQARALEGCMAPGSPITDIVPFSRCAAGAIARP